MSEPESYGDNIAKYERASHRIESAVSEIDRVLQERAGADEAPLTAALLDAVLHISWARRKVAAGSERQKALNTCYRHVISALRVLDELEDDDQL